MQDGMADFAGMPLAGDLFTDGSVEGPSRVSALDGWEAVVMGRDAEAASLLGTLPWPLPPELCARG
eukprot:2221276-Pyramimonas_sp.AAC.1